MGALVSDVPNCWVDRVPGERLARLALVEHDLLCALRRLSLPHIMVPHTVDAAFMTR